MPPSIRSLASLRRDLSLFAKYHLVRRSVRYPARELELGVVSLGFDLGAYVETLRGYEGPFSISTLAEVRFEGERFPILAVRSRAPAASLGSGARRRPRVVVLAGVHGNEHAGLLAVPRVLDRLAADAELAAQIDLTLVTPVNPVGAAHLSRYNGEGYDINRDFVRFDTVEARAVRRVIAQARPDFVVSLHEGPQDATFFFSNRHVAPALASRLLARMGAGGVTLARHDYFGRALREPGHAPMDTATYALTWAWARALRMMPTGFYADERAIPEITLESSWRASSLEARVGPHVDLVCALLAELREEGAGA
ncbi:MAG TPA: DUF2817 domain-containing protein [Polyangiaceae bacterium]|nr:DUF2817 domain-containing protein [Polyangiaceae bacterium]